jgi:hypothetical protein
MTISIGDYNLPNIKKEAERKLKRLQLAVALGTNRAANHIRSHTIDKIAKQGRTGNEYPRGEGRAHIASVPGEPPAYDYGKLTRGLRVTQAKPGLMAIAEMTSRAEYSEDLEFGTRQVAARPFMMPDEKTINEAGAMLRAEIEAAVSA